MGKKERNGIKKPRSSREPRRCELGNYRILTDTDNSERFFFEGLKASLPPEVRKKIEIIVSKKIKTKNLVKEAEEMIDSFKDTWIVFDRDQVPNFDELIDEAEHKDIHVAWSNPCIEIWFMAYYGSMPNGMNSVQCCTQFGIEFQKRRGEVYSKDDRNIYRKLIESGDEEKAIQTAKKKSEAWIKNSRDTEYIPPSERNACTLMFDIVAEIRSRTISKT